MTEQSSDYCDGHGRLEDRIEKDGFKIKFYIGLLSGNLLAIAVTIALQLYMAIWKIPDVEKNLTAKLTPIIEKIAKFEEWKDSANRRLEEIEKRLAAKGE